MFSYLLYDFIEIMTRKYIGINNIYKNVWEWMIINISRVYNDRSMRCINLEAWILKFYSRGSWYFSASVGLEFLYDLIKEQD